MVDLLFIIPLILVIVLYRNKTGENKFFIFLFMAFLFVLYGFRSAYGEANDTHNYLTVFTYGEEYMRTFKEPGYSWINVWILRKGLGFQWVLVIMAVIYCISLFWAAKRSDRKTIEVLIFYFLLTYYFYAFNAMRQMTALNILLVGYTYLYDKKWIKFIICVLCASLFHKTSLIVLPFVVFSFINLKFNNVFVCATLLLSLVVGSQNITATWLGFVADWFPDYVSSDVESSAVGSSFSFSRLTLTFFFMYIYCVSKEKNIYLSIVFIGIVLFNLMSFNTAAMRIAYTMTPVQALLYADCLKQKMFTKQSRNYIIIYSFFLYYYMLLNNISDMLNFEFCNMSSFSA